MKSSSKVILASLLALTAARAEDDPTYINQIWQIQLPGGANDAYIVPVQPTGEQLSPLPINPNGARFELWTIKSPGPVSYLLDTRYVGAFVPLAQVIIDSNDPYGKDLSVTGPVPANLPAMVRRTRVDKPFKVYITVSGLLGGAEDPPASKSVQFLHHVQSYGTGIGLNLNRNQATQVSDVPSSLSANSTRTFSYNVSGVPGGDRTKVRGEERFSVFSLDDNRGGGYHILPAQLSSEYIQVWPVAYGSISGISQNDLIRFSMPTLTIALKDLYPESRTYMRAYKGNLSSDPAVGVVVPGSNQIISDSTPQDRTLTISNYDTIFTGDGRWTMELLTVTPLEPGGAPLIERLGSVSFDVDRTIEVNGSFTTIE